LGNVLEWFVILIEEITWKLTHVLAVLELGGCDLGGLPEVAVLVQNFVNFILDLGFQVELF
jgi:hypothetical protein